MNSVEQQLIETARGMREELFARTDEFEAARRIPAELSARLAAAGFYRLFIPEACGGLEMAPVPATLAFEELALGDASAAWVAFIGATSGSMLAAIPPDAARAIFTRPELMLAGVAAPRGQAEYEGDGFRVNGHWQWGSGIQNADWVVAGCMVTRNGEPDRNSRGAPRNHIMLLPADQVELLDTWYVAGMQGTGSTDFEIRERHVPAEHAAGFRARYPDRPLYQFPQFCLLALGIAAVAMGIARVAIDELKKLATDKTPTGSSRSLAERPATQADVARAEVMLAASRSYLYEKLDEIWQRALAGNPLSIDDRRDLRLATTHAVLSASDAVDLMYNLGGGTSVYRSSRLQQCFRDVHVVTQHAMVAPATLEVLGRLHLGLPTNTATI